MSRPKGRRMFRPEEILRFREMHLWDGQTVSMLAEKAGVARTSMHFIVTGSTYKDVPMPPPKEEATDRLLALETRMETLEQFAACGVVLLAALARKKGRTE